MFHDRARGAHRRHGLAFFGGAALLGIANMPIGLLTLELYIPDAQSLKDKRQVLRSLKDRLRGHFNVAVAELEHQDLCCLLYTSASGARKRKGVLPRLRGR